MSEYITIKEACKLTGKSDKTIRNNFTSKEKELNKLTSKTSSKKIITRNGRQYLILKSFLIDYYNILPSNLLVKKSKVTSKKGPFTSKKQGVYSEKYKVTRKYLESLEKQVDVKDEQIRELQQVTKELTRQNDQSQRLIAQLQQTNSKLLLDMPLADEKRNKKESPFWWILFFILIAFLIGVVFVLFKLIGKNFTL